MDTIQLPVIWKKAKKILHKLSFVHYFLILTSLCVAYVLSQRKTIEGLTPNEIEKYMNNRNTVLPEVPDIIKETEKYEEKLTELENTVTELEKSKTNKRNEDATKFINERTNQ